MMKTARLTTEAFSVECPHCHEAQEEKRTGSQMFTAEDVEPGQVMNCTNDACKLAFRLPTKLQATAQ